MAEYSLGGRHDVDFPFHRTSIGKERARIPGVGHETDEAIR